MYKRAQQIKKLKKTDVFDIVVIGGGATGLGVALDATTRGYKTLLIEAHDFAKGTSSRSTKLVHGGVRYLAQGDIALVFEALNERGIMAKNAKHLVDKQAFLIPNYSTINNYYYTTGLKVYDWMSRSLSLGKTKSFNKKRTLEKLPHLKKDKLNSSVVYYDAQFDDARFAINLAQTAVENNAVLLNYTKATALTKNKNGKIDGLIIKDQFNGETKTIKSKVVVNATGIFIDSILDMDKKSKKKSIITSQGVHLVVENEFINSKHALMIPKTTDDRVLFAVPWLDKLIIGTTDTPTEKPEIEPKALEEEIDFIINTFNHYVDKQISKKDILSVFAGLRPLAKPKDDQKKSKEISRGHKINLSDSGLITISGGKWTTYRKIAEDTINKIIRAHKLEDAECVTNTLSLHGNMSKKSLDKTNPRSFYGIDLQQIEHLEQEDQSLSEKLHPNYPHTMAQVYWAMNFEFAQTVEDVLARRIRLLFLDAKAAIEAAPRVATYMMTQKKETELWRLEQISRFTELAKNYLITEKTI